MHSTVRLQSSVFNRASSIVVRAPATVIFMTMIQPMVGKKKMSCTSCGPLVGVRAYLLRLALFFFAHLCKGPPFPRARQHRHSSAVLQYAEGRWLLRVAQGAVNLRGMCCADSGPVVEARLHKAFYVVRAGKLVCFVGQPAAFQAYVVHAVEFKHVHVVCALAAQRVVEFPHQLPQPLCVDPELAEQERYTERVPLAVVEGVEQVATCREHVMSVPHRACLDSFGTGT